MFCCLTEGLFGHCILLLLIVWASSSNHFLAKLELGAGVEQQFDCLIVQNHQAMHEEVDRLDLTTWSMVCSSALHSQAAEEAIPQLYKQGQKRLTLVQRWLSQTQAVLGRVILRRWVPVSSMKMCSLVRLSAHSALHWWSTQCTTCMLLFSDKLMSCSAAGTNGCLDLRCYAFTLNGQVSAEWSRCPSSMTWHVRDSVAALWRISAGWIPEMMGRLSADAGCSCTQAQLARHCWWRGQ